MTMLIALVVLLSATTAALTPPDAGAASSAVPSTAQPGATEQPKAAPAPKPKLSCRYEEQTGTISARKRVCMTAEQWRQFDSQ